MLPFEHPVWIKGTNSPQVINCRQWLSCHVAQGYRPKFPFSHVLHTADVAPCIPVPHAPRLFLFVTLLIRPWSVATAQK